MGSHLLASALYAPNHTGQQWIPLSEHIGKTEELRHKKDERRLGCDPLCLLQPTHPHEGCRPPRCRYLSVWALWVVVRIQRRGFSDIPCPSSVGILFWKTFNCTNFCIERFLTEWVVFWVIHTGRRNQLISWSKWPADFGKFQLIHWFYVYLAQIQTSWTSWFETISTPWSINQNPLVQLDTIRCLSPSRKGSVTSSDPRAALKFIEFSTPAGAPP